MATATHDMNDIKRRMQGASAVLKTELSGLRTGRASAHLLDPVMVAKGGARLLDKGAHDALVLRLLPLASLVTPNVPEAEILTGMTIKTVATAALALFALGWSMTAATSGPGLSSLCRSSWRRRS